KAPPPPKVESHASGLFRQHCARCHGADGTGKTARARLPRIPDFTNTRWQQGRMEAQLLASVLYGKRGKMPAFREKINEKQARALVAHVRMLGEKQKGQIIPAGKATDDHPEQETIPPAGQDAHDPHEESPSREPAEPAEAGIPVLPFSSPGARHEE